MTDMTPDMFPAAFKSQMIHSYPVVSGMPQGEFYTSSRGEKDEAFERCLANRHLALVCRMYLDDLEASDD